MRVVNLAEVRIRREWVGLPNNLDKPSVALSVREASQIYNASGLAKIAPDSDAAQYPPDTLLRLQISAEKLRIPVSSPLTADDAWNVIMDLRWLVFTSR